MTVIDRLTEKFRDFPGIGPRQAKRFVYFLLSRNSSYLDELAKLIINIKKEIRVCAKCFRFFNSENGGECSICRNSTREKDKLMIVEKDVDLENIERSGAYSGLYFVLGGLIQILETEPEKKVRLNELFSRLEEDMRNNLSREIILAFSENAIGENTTQFLEQSIKFKFENYHKISHLGKGISKGAELEYLDGDTLKNALKNRY